jgi:molecular chaperone HscB
MKPTVSSSCSHFNLLGLPTTYDVSLPEIDAAYKQLQKRLHPDLHHRSPDTAALASAYSTRINMACDVLSDPVLRGQHLMMETYGTDPLSEDAGASFNDPELLMFVMEARQTIEDVNMDNVTELHQHHQEMMNEAVDALTEAFALGEQHQQEQTKTLIKLQYVSKMLIEIDQLTPVM